VHLLPDSKPLGCGIAGAQLPVRPRLNANYAFAKRGPRATLRGCRLVDSYREYQVERERLGPAGRYRRRAAQPVRQAGGARADAKGGVGFCPNLATCDNTDDMLAIDPRPGGATSNCAADNVALLDLAVPRLPGGYRRRVLVRLDGAGFSHDLLEHIAAAGGTKGRNWEFSVGWVLHGQGDGRDRAPPILWTSAGREYTPDFLVIETDGAHWVVEVKADKDMATADVQGKRQAAKRWANHVSAADEVDVTWRYLLVSESDATAAKGSWPALKGLGAEAAS